MVNGWKVAAIIFLLMAVGEALLFGWLIKLGTEVIQDENICAINICSESDAFIFDPVTSLCECYVGNELIHQEIVD